MRSLALLAGLLIALPARADDAPKQNTLTAKEVAEGWILLFDGETTFGWQVDGEVDIDKGELILGDRKSVV